MSRWFANNFISNPRVWAQHTIGSTGKYRLMQIVFLSFTAAGVMQFVASYQREPAATRSLVLLTTGILMVINGMLVWPLMILRALRACVPEPNAGRGFEVIARDDAGQAKSG